jgi:hypothetical protein
MNPIIEELKLLFLVQERGHSLESAAELYDQMNDDTLYTDALKEIVESGKITD